MKIEKLIVALLAFYCIFPAQCQVASITSYPFSNDPLAWQDLKVLDGSLSKQNLIFSSEIHGRKGTLDIRKKFILYLSEVDKLDIVGLEADYAYGYEINRYFETGDIGILKDLYKYHPEYTLYKRIDFYTHYSVLKQLNDSLTLNLKYVGLDVVRRGYQKGTIHSLSSLLLTANLDNTYDQIIEEATHLCEKRKLKFKNIQPWLNRLISIVAENEESLKANLSNEQQTALINIMHNLQQSIDIYVDRIYRREIGIFRNYKRYIEPNQYAYAQYGKQHTFLRRWKEWGNPSGSFLDQLEGDSLYQNKLLVIQFLVVSDKKDRSGLHYQPLTKTEFEEIKPILENNEFPQLVDFRKMESVKDCFDFAIIVED
jgi:hypothetical protein